MPEYVTRLVGAIDVPLVLHAVYWLILALLVAPIVYFLRFGWERRKREFMNSLSDAAAARYLHVFHSSEYPESSEKVLRANQAAKPPNPSQAEAAAQTWADFTGMRALFEQFFSKEFGRRRFIVPALILLLLGMSLLYLALHAGLAWLKDDAAKTGVPIEVVLAVLGGFSWVINDLIGQARRDQLSPTGLMWSSFRLLVSVPAAYAIAAAFNSSLAKPMAYLLGTLPTDTLTVLGRRALGKTLGDTDAPKGAVNQIQNLTAVDTEVAARLAAEGITTFAQLAYADPVRLSIRTGLTFNDTVTLASEALLGVYLGNDVHIQAARRYGLWGSFECANLLAKLTASTAGKPPDEAKAIDQERAAAEAIVKDLSPKLDTVPEGLRNILAEIAGDPYTRFLQAVWASTAD